MYKPATEAEVEAMTEEELLKALVVGRMETAILISEDLKKVYFEAKAYEIKFAEKEATKKIIKEIDGVSQILVGTYSTLLTGYREFITSLEDLKYDTLISPDSEYQILLAKVREAKAKYLEQRSFVLTLEAGDVKVKAEVELNNLKKAYEDNGKKIIVTQLSKYIKYYAREMTGWDLSEETKPRELLQQLGTSVIREYLQKDDLFINRMIDDIDVFSCFYDAIIISDVRLKKEIHDLKASYPNAKVVHIIRPDFDNGLTEEQKKHKTEIDLDDFTDYDVEIVNTTLEKLEEDAKKLYIETEG